MSTPMTRMNRPALLALGTALTMGAALGCSSDPTRGYTLASQYPEDVSTVFVPIFQRGTPEFRQGLEFRVTEAVQKALPLRAGYRIADKAHADTILLGTIQQYEELQQRVLSNNPATGQPREIQLRLVVDLTWKDLRSGRILHQEKAFTATSEYLPTAPFNEDFFQGSEDAINKLAERIVERLAKPW